MSVSATLADAVSERRLWALLEELATIGATGRGGVNRQALTELDTAAKAFICGWASDHGLQCLQDEAANLFIRLEGTASAAAPVFIGSHLDTQPTGGRFDGAYGVVAGLEILASLIDIGVQPNRSIEVVAWTNEEGCRFQPGATGSSVFAGTRSLADLWHTSAADEETTLQKALERSIAATPAMHRAASSVRPHAYIEPHIEQGPVLEGAGVPIGVVTGIQGVRRFNVEISGATAHAGTAPLRTRRDALIGAVRAITALSSMCDDPQDVLRFTVGRLDVQPGSPNTVADRAVFTIDLRHPSAQTLDGLEAAFGRSVADAAAPCASVVTAVSAVAPTEFPLAMQSLIRDVSEALGYRTMDMVSGAGHDSIHLATVCPSGMVFVPCRAGLSHHEDEYASPEHLATGARVTAAAALQLALD